MEWSAGGTARYFNKREHVDWKRHDSTWLVEQKYFTLISVHTYEMKADLLENALVSGDMLRVIASARLFVAKKADFS